MKKVNMLLIFSLCVLSGCEKQSVPVDLCPNDPNKTSPGVCGCGNDDVIDAISGQFICSDPRDLCPNDPNKTDPGICGCGQSDEDKNRNGLADCVDDKIDLCPDDPNKKFPGACGCNAIDIIGEDGAVTCMEDKIDLCPDDPNKTKPGVCGCGVSDEIDVGTGVPNCIFEKIDLCPDDPDKKLPGACGCGIPDIDLNGNTILDCNEIEIDLCPYNPDKTQPGSCGCAINDIIWDGTIDLCAAEGLDLCPNDPDKTNPGICGCGQPDIDSDEDGLPDCISNETDYCPDDENKILPGICGCGQSDTDVDELTGASKCISDLLDLCPDDETKTRPGICGCGIDDNSDLDGDNVPDCIDVCPNDPEKSQSEGICGCGIADSDDNISDFDGDGIPNCLDACPETPWKSTKDSCECNAIEYQQDAETSLCAQIISNAKDFIDFRDKWNDGSINTSTSKVFFVVDNINLGDVLSREDAEAWVGIGTKDHPFDAIFSGYRMNSENADMISISAVLTNGHLTEKLTLGNENESDISLFGYTQTARIKDLDIKLSFAGNDHVAGLTANAIESDFSNIHYSDGTISGKTFVAGLAAEMTGCSIKNIIIHNSGVTISAEDAFVGGLTASANNSQISNVAVYGSVSGNHYVGGIAGQLKTSMLNSAYSEGTISGNANTGGVVGNLTGRASVFNVYTTSRVTCHEAPCASLIASISDFSTVKNAYTSGIIIDEIETDSSEPDGPPIFGDPNDPRDDPEFPSGEEPSSGQASVPIASLIASFDSEDNVVDKLYYWNSYTVPAFPESVLTMKYVAAPLDFAFYSLTPMTEKREKLIDILNGNLTCFGDNSCTLDGTSCLPWSVASRLISRPGSTQMTVSIPTLIF